MYSGYVIKIKGISGTSYSSDYIMPLQYMVERTYKGTYSVLDSNSKRNGNGKLVRTPLPHKVPHCSVDIRPLSNVEVGEMMVAIKNRYTKASEKKVRASIWVAEIDDYIETDFYVPDIEFIVRKLENTKILYEQFTIEFIGY